VTETLTPARVAPWELDAARPRAAASRVQLSQVLAALSHALDLTEGQPVGHSIRSCLIAMRIARELDLDGPTRSALYYAMLLKDAGCSSNAARIAILFGADDRLVKPRMKIVDWHRSVRLAVETFRSSALGGPLRERVHHFLAIARARNTTHDLIQIRCDRGAEIARRLGFPDATANAIRSLDEHWNGRGYPDGVAGDDIPLLSRIANIAQTVEVVHAADGVDAALSIVRQRRRTWFDPALADLILSWRNDRVWWQTVTSPDVIAAVVDSEPFDHVRVVSGGELEGVARAFADIIDAKSPYTYRHSTRVADIARGIASVAGLDAVDQDRLFRAGLLHDIGKLGVSSRILDKPAALTADERRAVERHPLHTWEILSHVSAFAELAPVASAHHEKLDGSGYPWGLTREQLDFPSRILAVADVYEALTADRPYRAGLSREEALEIITRDRGNRLCLHAVDALEAHSLDLEGL
jgi:HD-GYP domain-containing protein (c-di-GMP phosphodiesterase class II)